MSNKIIDEIILSEKKSEQIISAAKQQAVKSLTLAEEKGAELRAQAQQKNKEDINNYILQYENESKLNFNSTLVEYQKTAQQLQEKAEKNYQSAVDLIIKNLN